MSKAKRNDGGEFSDRVRFNWGFHDAQFGMANGYDHAPGTQMGLDHTHPDQAAYGQGAIYGVKFFERYGKRADSSEPAWIEYQHEVERYKQIAAMSGFDNGSE